MKVKRYFASNMRSALDMIKQDQGPDVLILSNRNVDGGVELITADALSAQEAARLAAQQPPRRRPDLAAEREPAAKPASEPAPRAAAEAPTRQPLLPPGRETDEFLWTDSGTVAQMREELRNLKGLLESQLSSLAWTDFGGRHPLRARLMRVLAQIGICPNLARALVEKVPDELDYRAGWHRVLALLVMRLRMQNDPVMREGGRIALLGPTGVGKSTVVSKLAARYALKHGSDKVAIVSMDDRRLGAHQQMKAFGRLIGAVVMTARDVTELAGQLDELAQRRLVLIDTPGNAPDDQRFRELAQALDQLAVDVQCYNVMSATTDYLASTKLFRVTADLGLTGCILTKLDEAATLGPSLSAIIESGLPLAYTSAGQRVPDDLDVVDPRALIELTVELAKATPMPRHNASFEQAFPA